MKAVIHEDDDYAAVILEAENDGESESLERLRDSGIGDPVEISGLTKVVSITITLSRYKK